MISLVAILVVRVIHLWNGSRTVQRLVFLAFLLCVSVAMVIFAFIMKASTAVALPSPFLGCFPNATGPNGHLYWSIFVPTFLLESLLVILTVVRASRSLKKNRESRLLKCLVRDGCLFYCAVCFCIGFEVTGSSMWKHPEIYSPSVVSGFVQAFLSVCASRLLFSLHELADELIIGQPTFVLNNIEMSRLQLRRGERPSEYVVEVHFDMPVNEYEGKQEGVGWK